jgi:hypothetical protein
MKLKNSHAVLMVIIFCIISYPIKSEEALVDDFRIAIGGYALTRFDSAMSLTDRNVGAGVSIVPEDTLGWNTEQTVLRLDGYYRFTNEHAITISWYRINANGNKILTEDIEWTDQDGNAITIPTGASVSSSFGYNIYKIGYLWSFYHTDKVELSVGAGFHVTRLDVNLTANTTSSGEDPNDVKTTVPLPVVSVALNYHITPRLNWYMSSQFFSMSYDTWNGVYTDSELGMEYRFTKHLGVGVGFGSNALKVNEETDEYKFSYENRITGVLVYLAGYF